MKLNLQTQHFINGVILLFLGLLSVTFFPMIAKFGWERYVYLQIEFFLLVCSSVFFLFSPKYFKHQVMSILLGILYYLLFVKFFN